MHNIFEVFKSLRGNKAHNIYLVTPETCCQRKILSPVSELTDHYTFWLNLVFCVRSAHRLK